MINIEDSSLLLNFLSFKQTPCIILINVRNVTLCKIEVTGIQFDIVKKQQVAKSLFILGSLKFMMIWKGVAPRYKKLILSDCESL